jgi:hypothetical protein
MLKCFFDYYNCNNSYFDDFDQIRRISRGEKCSFLEFHLIILGQMNPIWNSLGVNRKRKEQNPNNLTVLNFAELKSFRAKSNKF